MSQVLLVSIDQITDGSPCPDDVYKYGINIIEGPTGNWSNTIWEVTGGEIVDNGEINDQYCDIKWYDNTIGIIKISRICCEIHNVTTLCKDNVIKEVKIRSLKDVVPVFSSGSTVVELENITAITYSINRIKYGTDEAVTSYYWNIPENWVSGGNVSTGSNIFITSSPDITVIPDNCSDGQIKVWSPNTFCTSYSSSNVTPRNIIRSYPNFTISGPHVFCLTGVYTVSNIGSNYSVSWSSSSSAVLTSGQGTDIATFSKVSDDDNCKITANISYTACSNEPISKIKSVNIGVPNYTKIDISLDGDYLLACDYTSAEADYDGTAGIDGYEWFMPDANNWEIEEESGAGPDNKYVEIDYWEDPAPYYEVIYVRARNECGWSYWAHKTFSVIDNCGGFFMMVIFPNPADTYVELSFIEDSTPILREHVEKNQIKFKKKNRDSEVEEFLIQILDKNATVRKSVQTNKLKINIPTNDLEPSTYFIHVTIGVETYKQQLIIK